MTPWNDIVGRPEFAAWLEVTVRPGKLVKATTVCQFKLFRPEALILSLDETGCRHYAHCDHCDAEFRPASPLRGLWVVSITLAGKPQWRGSRPAVLFDDATFRPMFDTIQGGHEMEIAFVNHGRDALRVTAGMKGPAVP